MLNDSIHYQDGALYSDAIPISEIVAQTGTPVYIYSLKRALGNFRRVQTAFGDIQPHIHYSAKANANLSILRALVSAGAGIDAVSAGEIHKALLAGAEAKDIVFAGVGKTASELAYAIEKGVGWINVENVAECALINDIVRQQRGKVQRIALRLNPDVTANTHPYIATGHSGTKFGLTADTVRELLAKQSDYPHICFEGIHIHIGSQLHDTEATQRALEIALELIEPYPNIRTVNIGGGLPVAYRPDEVIPSWENFATSLRTMLAGYMVLLEPGRSIIADAGMLVASVLYVKEQAGQTILITDGSMAELIRPALYQAHHEIVPVIKPSPNPLPHGEGVFTTQVVGPICETADIIGRDISLPHLQAGDLLAVLTAGAYGMAMANNYNQRPRPPEVVVAEDGQSWHIARRRETWDDLVRLEV
ncbi:MAG: diaminopimelate decarboxylase [Chloroflexota bacterium]